MTVAETILKFLNHLAASGFAEATIINYTSSLGLFLRHLDSIKIVTIRQVTSRVIEDYQAAVMDEKVALVTRARKVQAVKRLFDHLMDTNQLLVNPAQGIHAPGRHTRKIGAVLTLDEVRAMLDQPDLSKKAGIRDRAILEVFYATGIRINELVHLDVDHVDFEGGVVFIRTGKGRRQRVAPLGKNGRKHLAVYMDTVRPCYVRKGPAARRLFLLITGRPMNGPSVRQIIRKHRIRAGISKRVSPHTLRRTCATHMLENGADIRYIQALLGHKCMSTTQQYTRVRPKHIKNIHAKTHPNGGSHEN